MKKRGDSVAFSPLCECEVEVRGWQWLGRVCEAEFRYREQGCGGRIYTAHHRPCGVALSTKQLRLKGLVHSKREDLQQSLRAEECRQSVAKVERGGPLAELHKSQ